MSNASREFDPDLPAPRGEGRTVIFTPRFLTRKVYRGVFFEFEETIAKIEDVDFHAPEKTRLGSPLLFLEKAAGRVKRELRLPSTPVSHLVPSELKGSYDLGFIIFAYPADIPAHLAVKNWKQRCRTTACYLGEHWPADFTNPRTRANLKLLSRFDHVFCHCPQVEELSALIGRPCTHLPVGVDALRFSPMSLHAPREIGVYSVGRRSASAHEDLRARANAGELLYLYDTAFGFDVRNWREHRDLIANNIKHSEFFISYKHNVSLTSLTSGVEAVGARLFEGAAGGAIQIGIAPDCDTYRQYFDWPDAVIPMPYDCAQPWELIQDLRRQPERLAAARREGVSKSLLHNDWSHRWRKILETLDLPPDARFLQRQDALAGTHDSLVQPRSMNLSQSVEVPC